MTTKKTTPKEEIKTEEPKQVRDESQQGSFLTQLVFLDALTDYIDRKAAQKLKNDPNDAYESDITQDINTALAKAQGDFPVIGTNRENNYLKNQYGDLNVLVRSIKPSLMKNGLSFTQQEVLTSNGSIVLKTRIRHSSGQWIEARAKIAPVKNDSQSYGAALTYAKRYSLSAILGLTVSNDPLDDDAESLMYDVRDVKAKGVALNTAYNSKEELRDTITKEQYELLEHELKGQDEVAEKILTTLKIQSLVDMPKSVFVSYLNRIKEVKNAEEEANNKRTS